MSCRPCASKLNINAAPSVAVGTLGGGGSTPLGLGFAATNLAPVADGAPVEVAESNRAVICVPCLLFWVLVFIALTGRK